MNFFLQFRSVSEADKSNAVKRLIVNSTPDSDFFYLIILSILMAAFGLLLDSATVVIGSMLIAPILYPILSLSLGVVMSDDTLIRRSLYTVLKSLLFGIIAAFIATILLSSPESNGVGGTVISQINPSLLYFAVAFVAGLAVSYSLVKPKLNETFPGIVVSVALIPPLAAVGIGLAKLNWDVISAALVLFLVNVFGIVFASMVSFSLMNLYAKRDVAESAIWKEGVRVETEKESRDVRGK